MKGTLGLAWRNLWRNRRRTFISMSAIGIGLFLVVFYSGLVAGILGDAKNQLDAGGMGHVEVFATGYRPKKPAATVMPAFSALEPKLALPAGAEVGGRVIARGLASSAHGSEPVELLGVDFARERLLSAHLRDVRAGALPEPGDTRGLVVGEQLAQRLKLKPGARVRVMAQRADGEMGVELFRVRGVFHSVAPTIGKRQVFASAAAARELLGVEGSHQVVIQLALPDTADAEASRLQAALGEGFEVKSWGELIPILRRLEGLIDTVIVVISIFVYLLVGLGVLNTMLMSVLERTREFGVLMALGTRPAKVVALVIAESFWIATLAVAAGALLGGFATWWFSENAITLFSNIGESFEMEGLSLSTNFKTRFSLTDLGQAAAYVYVMALVVGIYPALRVVKLSPAEALRHT
ncbi:MAG: ABC transporter permease [Myxococcaceae bacterium]|nr:ABC transporter permease [Myxococcaceae bacterium]